MRFLPPLAALALLPAVLGGCSLRTLAARQTAGLLEAAQPSFEAEPDPDLAREAFPSTLKLAEGLLETDPGNETLLLLALRGYASYAFLFVEPSDEARARALYARARDYGFLLLRERGLLPSRRRNLVAWSEALEDASKEDAPALFWTAFAWASGINLSREDPMALADLPMAMALAQRARDLDPGVWFGGPDALLGFYHGSRPTMLGGSPEKSLLHFERAFELSGGQYLLWNVLFARTYAVQTQQKDAFVSALRSVIASGPASAPRARLANAVARRRARALLENADELFP